MVRSLLALGLAILVVILSANHSVHAIAEHCIEAVAIWKSCLPFVRGGAVKPTDAPCCLAVKTVNDGTVTKEDRKNLCECLKRTGSIVGVKPEKAKQLPESCHIKDPVPIDPNLDCDK